MSLNFSRRSFFRFIATAILTVACVGLLTACSNLNNPSLEGFGTIRCMSVDAKLTDVNGTTSGTTIAAADTFTAKLTIKNGADNQISVTSDNFALFVTHGDETTENSNAKTSGSVTVENGTVSLAKGKSVDVVVTVTGLDLEAGDTVKLTYWPRTDYNNNTSSWILKVVE